MCVCMYMYTWSVFFICVCVFILHVCKLVFIHTLQSFIPSYYKINTTIVVNYLLRQIMELWLFVWKLFSVLHHSNLLSMSAKKIASSSRREANLHWTSGLRICIFVKVLKLNEHKFQFFCATNCSAEIRLVCPGGAGPNTDIGVDDEMRKDWLLIQFEEWNI